MDEEHAREQGSVFGQTRAREAERLEKGCLSDRLTWIAWIVENIVRHTNDAPPVRRPTRRDTVQGHLRRHTHTHISVQDISDTSTVLVRHLRKFCARNGLAGRWRSTPY